MCRSCTPERVLGPQPSRRPKARAGHHTTGSRTAHLELLCDGMEVRAWWSAAGIRCVECWHKLEDPLADPLDLALRQKLRADIGRLNNLVADDFDDSDLGLRAMADQLKTTHPYLRLRSAGSRATLFAITSFQHSIIALDGASTDYTVLLRTGEALDKKIDAEIDNLLKAAIK